MYKAPVRLGRLSRRQQVLYYVGVGMTILLVLLGWIFSARQALMENVKTAKSALADSAHTAQTELEKTRALRAQAQEGIQKAKTTGGSLFELHDKKEAISNQLIESLKAQLETDALYGTQAPH
ncbi:MAG: hypothetical protein AAB431_02955 [Patescibacteria group bacterium]